MNIWELAREQLKENEERTAKLGLTLADGQTVTEVIRQQQATVVVCGAKGSGKTSMILRFLDKNEQTRPTIALEYTFARRTRGTSRQLAHIWELANGTSHLDLLSIPISATNIATTGVIITVDLTRPFQMRETLEKMLEATRNHVEKAMATLNRTDIHLYDEIENATNTRMENNKDLAMCRPFPVPLAIVGNKYDEFQNLDSDERRKVCKALRFVSHYHGAALMFYSTRMETTLGKGRLLFSHLAFSANLGRAIQTDFNKPLFVPFGMDSFADIGPPPVNESYSAIKATLPIDLWWMSFSESFPSTEAKNEKASDPSTDPLFLEPSIDTFIEQKKRELEQYAKQRRERQAAEERAAEKLRTK